MGSDESRFNVSVLGSEGQGHKKVSTNHKLFWLERRAEAVSNRGPSAYQPNALLLGQTGSPAYDFWEETVISWQHYSHTHSFLVKREEPPVYIYIACDERLTVEHVFTFLFWSCWHQVVFLQLSLRTVCHYTALDNVFNLLKEVSIFGRLNFRINYSCVLFTLKSVLRKYLKKRENLTIYLFVDFIECW